jgi:transcriptional regulator with XRE-family HTH domain
MEKDSQVEKKRRGRPPSASLPPFAEKLKTLREAAGLTQGELATRAKLHLGAIFKLEQGAREPSWATVQAVAKALGVDCQAFESEAGKAAGRPRKGKVAGQGK